MDVFIWNTVISFQLLFIIVSAVIFLYIKDKSFKHYVLYNVFLSLYILSRNDLYYDQFTYFIGFITGYENSLNFTKIFNFYIQVIFYCFYCLFALYFLDLNRHLKKYFYKVRQILKAIVIAFTIFGVICFILKDPKFYKYLYAFLFLPIMLGIFFTSLGRALKFSGKHKNFFLIGVCAYIFCALLAFITSSIDLFDLKNPIIFFYIGIIIETLFFSLGLAYKIKLINDEKNRVNNLFTQNEHQQQISKLKGLLEGEENERKRIAEELHDGIAGDLSAIKYNLAYLKQRNNDPENEELLVELSQIIDKSYIQLREISHNLSPTAITNYGLLLAIENYCKKIEITYHIKINYHLTGESFHLSNTSETHIYRIIQELLNNVVKHSEATIANVEIINNEPNIYLKISDNGKGFCENINSKGIGLSNIDSRIRFLDAELYKKSDENGTSFDIHINTDKISHLT